MESFRQDFLNDVAEHGAIVENNLNTHFSVNF